MISIALLGFGCVGSGTAEVLTENKKIIEERLGCEYQIKYILDLREFPDSPFGKLVVHDFNTILNDPEVTVVAEMMGGSHPAYDFTKACLEAGKSVVTSNKEVVAKFGVELGEIAARSGARYLFEASVGGGIPLIRPMTVDLASNKIKKINGILNGTTNYIITYMRDAGVSFEDALREAQRLGYAEANPEADVEGIDAARKAVILGAVSTGKLIS
ncbi:MAG: homoserine dehydrogenase, partial [Clostridia bacterium]|nr:homoserine dehydrogenase [Clostridia bacterium]